jgi:putative flippase GtrA
VRNTFNRPVRFAAVGVASTLVDVGVFTMFVAYLAVPPVIASVAGYSLGVVNGRSGMPASPSGRVSWRGLYLST